MKKLIVLLILLIPSLTYPRTLYWNPSGNALWSAENVWALTDGGSATEENPTSSDSCYFTNTNVNNCTLGSTSNCADLSFTGGTGYTGTFSVGSYDLNVYGSLTFSSGMTFTKGSKTIYMKSTSTGKTITAAGKAFNNLYFDGSGGGWTLQDSTYINGILTVNQGSFNTGNSNHAWNTFTCTGTGTRSITMGTGTIYIFTTGGPLWTLSGSNYTFNDSTSTIKFTGYTSTGNVTMFQSGGATYYNVIYENSGSTAGYYTFDGSPTIANNFTVIGISNIFTALNPQSDITINGVCSLNGKSSKYRLWVGDYGSYYGVTPAEAGTVRTITCNGSWSGQYVDFWNITGAGSASRDLSSFGGGSGDLGGNTNFTFTTADTIFWIGATGDWSDSTQWSTSSGGEGGSRVPLVQDLARFDNNSFSGATQVVTFDMWNAGNMDWTGVTNTPDLTFNTNMFFAGTSCIWSTDMTHTTGSKQFAVRSNVGNVTLKLTKTIYLLSIWTPKKVTLANDLTVLGETTYGFAFEDGTFDSDTYNVSANRIKNSSNLNRTLYMGQGTWTLANATPLTLGSNLTLYAETSLLSLNPDSGATDIAFDGLGKTFYNVTFRAGAGSTDYVTMTGSNTFNTLTITKPRILNLTAGTTTTINSNLVAIGDASNIIQIKSATSAQHTLDSDVETISVQYCTITYSNATGDADWQAYTTNNNVDGGNNSGWVFTEPVVSTGNALFMIGD